MRAAPVKRRAWRVLAAAAGLGAALAAGAAVVSQTQALTLPAPGPQPELPSQPAAPEEHRRTPDQTFLTFPEWYLVHSPAEYAAYLGRGERPSGFPLFSHVGQFWQSYAAVSREIAKYPFNGGYHLMVNVIGASTTLEYGVKGAWEHTLGRLAEASMSGTSVPEEDFAARYAQAYVDFIRVQPWYEFDFDSQLRALWSGPAPLSGPDLLRRWERRFALSSELLVKAGYARLIKLGTRTVYDPPKPVTAVLLSRAPVPDAAAHGELQALTAAPRADGRVLATVPRYQAFTDYAGWLAAQGIDILEIAGNAGEVVVSELTAADAPLPPRARLLFEQPIQTRPGQRRIVFALPVARLGDELRRVAAQPRDGVEHVYDF